MDDKKIARINELYHKSKAEGLTAEEAKEQQILRRRIYRFFQEKSSRTAEQYFDSGKKTEVLRIWVKNLEIKKEIRKRILKIPKKL